MEMFKSYTYKLGGSCGIFSTFNIDAFCRVAQLVYNIDRNTLLEVLRKINEAIINRDLGLLFSVTNQDGSVVTVTLDNGELK